MNFTVQRTPLEGLVVIEPKVFRDERGYLSEIYRKDVYLQLGIDREFVQDNQSLSKQNVLRGLHAQIKNPQAKLVRVVVGEIFDVGLDARPESKTFGQWYGQVLSSENCKQLFIPEGFFHGFCVFSKEAVVHYKCSDVYQVDDQWGLLWNDQDIGIQWPLADPLVSEKDRKNISWARFKELVSGRGRS